MGKMKRLLSENPHGVCETMVGSLQATVNTLAIALEELMELEGGEPGEFDDEAQQQEADRVWEQARFALGIHQEVEVKDGS